MKENQITRLMNYVDNLRHRYHKAVSFFYAFEALEEACVTSIVGNQEAHNNVEVIKRFGGFFLPAKESLRICFFLELAKLVDKSDQSLRVEKVINFAKSNVKRMNSASFADHNSDRPFMLELISNYSGINHTDFNKIDTLIQGQETFIDKLVVFRDRWLAHDDANKPDQPPDISSEEIHKFLEAFEEVLDILTSRVNYESTTWEHTKSDARDTTLFLLNNLYRFEKYRLIEIENELQEELESISQSPDSLASKSRSVKS